MTEYVGVDEFASSLGDILDKVGDATDEVLDKAVRKGCQVTAKAWRANAPKRRGKYAKSISYRVQSGGHEAEGQVGSKTMPGLPHLLEKGHAKVGGGRVPAYPHIADAAEDGFDATMDTIESGMGSL